MRRPSLDIRQVPRRQNTRSLPPVTPDDVWRVITATPANTSPLDIVPVSTIKLCVDTFVPIIVRLSNLSFAEGRFRECNKTAQVAPLLKKHMCWTLLKKPVLDRTVPANYRSISNLSTISEILERLAPAQLRTIGSSRGS
jgi:hypothetical protein